MVYFYIYLISKSIKNYFRIWKLCSSKEYSEIDFSLEKTALSILEDGDPWVCNQFFILSILVDSPSSCPLTVRLEVFMIQPRIPSVFPCFWVYWKTISWKNKIELGHDSKLYTNLLFLISITKILLIFKTYRNVH